ncbi:hypothetical protein D910_12579, partial [Dendroctonus ponderosae]
MKNLSNNTTLSRSGRRHRMGGMTSSSSATSCNSNCNENILQPNGDIPYHEQHTRALSNGFKLIHDSTSVFSDGEIK